MKKILWVGDGPDCPSGFGRATREIVASLDHRLGGPFDVTVLGMNYMGDPGSVPYPVYAAAVGEDAFGVGRLIWMLDTVRPDILCIQQDGWNIPYYVHRLAQVPEYAKLPVVAIVAVDGKNFNGEWLKGVTLAIFWTQFALREARKGGYTGAAKVIPLGVDLEVYSPGNKPEARKARSIDVLGNEFIVGSVNRNQPRKRLDLLIRYFSEWIHGKQISDACLYVHAGEQGEQRINVVRLAKYYGVLDRLVHMEPKAFYGVTELEMRDTYRCFDVYVSTTQGEGMGLPAMEAMACCVPCILPDWSAYGDWARDAAALVSCTSTAICAPFVNVIGGVADEGQFVEALDLVYRDRDTRNLTALAGRERVLEERFRWANIGQRYVNVVHGVLKVDVQIEVAS